MMNNGASNLSHRCKTETGTLIHMFWDCMKLDHYSIRDTTERIIGADLLWDQSVLPPDKRLNPQFIKMALTAGNKCIAMTWKDEYPPFFSMLFTEIVSYRPVKRNIFNLSI